MTHRDTSKLSDPPQKVVSEARAWAERMVERDLTAAERVSFEEWLLRDAAHEMEFHVEFEIRFRLAQLPDSEHAAVRGVVTPPRYLPEQRRWPSWAWAAAMTFLVIAASVWWFGLPSGQHYVTDTGEKLSTNLADGSRVELNAQTDLEWLGAGPCDRRVRLVRGEALFKVSGDPKCPFQVLVGRGRIEVLGTEFDVHQDHEGEERVSVLEGRVRLHSGAGVAPWQVDLEAGEQATWNEGPPSTRRLEDPSKATAWREDRVDFENQPLGQVVEELQHYTALPIRIENDPRLLCIRVTGELQVDEAHIHDSLLRLGKRPEIEIKEDGHSLVLAYRPQLSHSQVPP
jgi:transmembrane sensor